MQRSEERRYWMRLIAEFGRQGGSHAAFCASHEVPLTTFGSWLYRLRREGAQGPPRFMEVRGASQVGAPPIACVVAIGGVEARFAVLPSAEYIAAVLRAASSEAS